MWYINGTRLDDRIVRTDWDAGFVEGRQYGRGKSGGQVRTFRSFLTNHLQLCQADYCILSRCPSSHTASFCELAQVSNLKAEWPIIRPALISYLVISSMRQQGVFLLPPGRNASLLIAGLSPALFKSPVTRYTWLESSTGRKVSLPRTQDDDSSKMLWCTGAGPSNKWSCYLRIICYILGARWVSEWLWPWQRRLW